MQLKVVLLTTVGLLTAAMPVAQLGELPSEAHATVLFPARNF